MVALGLVLLVLAALLTVGVVLFNTDPANAAAFGVTLANVSIGGLFLVGVITGVVGALGLFLLLGGVARSRSKRVSTKRRVRSATHERDALAEENARLAEQLERERAAQPYPSDGSSARAPQSERR